MDAAEGQASWIRDALERYERPLVRYALRLTGDVELAQDAVQDTFLRLCRRTPAELGDHLAPWLFRVCRNRALDLVRKEQHMNRSADGQATHLTSPAPGPGALAEHRDAQSRILVAVTTLPARQQEVVRLKFQNELSYKEIGEVMGLTVTNVGFLVHTAIKALREQLHAGGDAVRPAGRSTR